MERLSLDIERCLSGEGGVRGLSQTMLDGLKPRLDGALRAVLDAAGTGMLGWTELPRQNPEPLIAFGEERRGKYDCLLVIGIGGSALGTTALATALLPFFYNELGPAERGQRPRLYVLDNVDPEETAALLDRLDLGRTLVNVISKCGTTGESMAGYLVARERLGAAVGEPALKDHLVFTTDPTGGVLRKIGVSSAELDTLVAAARRAGAWGAKLSGGGQGGTMIALVPPDRAEGIAKALQKAGAVRTIATVIK